MYQEKEIKYLPRAECALHSPLVYEDECRTKSVKVEDIISPLHPHSVWNEHGYPDHIPSTSPQCLERTWVFGPYPLYIPTVSGTNMGIRTISLYIPAVSGANMGIRTISLYIPTVSGANMNIRTISLYIPAVSGANMGIRTISPLHPRSVWSEHGYSDHIPSTSPQCLERT